MNTETLSIKKILLVEDDPRDVELTLAALKEHNLANQVAVVHDGAEALDYLYCREKFKTRANGHPVLLLLDLKLPKVSGLEVLKIIPVVVLSSSREMPDVVECYRHGVNAYVVKPVDFAEFMEAVKLLGIFWAAINEPPPIAGKIEVKNEIPAAKQKTRTTCAAWVNQEPVSSIKREPRPGPGTRIGG